MLLLVLGLDIHNVDYMTIFYQASLVEIVFVELPGDFNVLDQVLLLQQSVYRLRQSPLNFYKHLRQGLEDRGFTKAAYDKCPFTNGIVIVLL